MIIQGHELLGDPSAARSLKFVANEQGILIFLCGQEHRTVKATGISYEEGPDGNALAGLIQPAGVEIRNHGEFSPDRVKGLWSKLTGEPRLASLRSLGVKYGGCWIQRGPVG